MKGSQNRLQNGRNGGSREVYERLPNLILAEMTTRNKGCGKKWDGDVGTWGRGRVFGDGDARLRTWDSGRRDRGLWLYSRNVGKSDYKSIGKADFFQRNGANIGFSINSRRPAYHGKYLLARYWQEGTNTPLNVTKMASPSFFLSSL